MTIPTSIPKAIWDALTTAQRLGLIDVAKAFIKRDDKAAVIAAKKGALGQMIDAAAENKKKRLASKTGPTKKR